MEVEDCFIVYAACLNISLYHSSTKDFQHNLAQIFTIHALVSNIFSC